MVAIIIDNKKVFATQREYGEFKDGWEFPGGKIEPVESLKGFYGETTTGER